MADKITIQIDKDLEELIPGFLNNREKDVEVFTASIATKDFKTIEAVAHRLAGNAGSYGFTKLGDIGKSIELAAQQHDMNTINTGLANMINYLANIDIIYS